MSIPAFRLALASSALLLLGASEPPVPAKDAVVLDFVICQPDPEAIARLDLRSSGDGTSSRTLTGDELRALAGSLKDAGATMVASPRIATLTGKPAVITQRNPQHGFRLEAIAERVDGGLDVRLRFDRVGPLPRGRKGERNVPIEEESAGAVHAQEVLRPGEAFALLLPGSEGAAPWLLLVRDRLTGDDTWKVFEGLE